MDLLIAAQASMFSSPLCPRRRAVCERATVITNSVQHFEHLPRLKLAQWKQGQPPHVGQAPAPNKCFHQLAIAEQCLTCNRQLPIIQASDYLRMADG
jgi:hypothetical protein